MVSGRPGRWAGPQAWSPGLPWTLPWVGLFPETGTHGGRAQDAPATAPSPSTVPGQGMIEQLVLATESRVSWAGSSVQELEPCPPPLWTGVLVSRTWGSNSPFSPQLGVELSWLCQALTHPEPSLAAATHTPQLQPWASIPGPLPHCAFLQSECPSPLLFRSLGCQPCRTQMPSLWQHPSRI